MQNPGLFPMSYEKLMYFLSGDIVKLIPGNDAPEDAYLHAPHKAL